MENKNQNQGQKPSWNQGSADKSGSSQPNQGTDRKQQDAQWKKDQGSQAQQGGARTDRDREDVQQPGQSNRPTGVDQKNAKEFTRDTSKPGSETH